MKCLGIMKLNLKAALFQLGELVSCSTLGSLAAAESKQFVI